MGNQCDTYEYSDKPLCSCGYVIGSPTCQEAHSYPTPVIDITERLRATGEPCDVEAAGIIEGLRALVDPEFSYRDLETHIRDGTFELRAVGGKEGGDPAMRLLCAVLLNVLLGPENEEPRNYRMVQWELTAAGTFEKWRVVAEIIKPGGKSSHEIREELEAALAAPDDEL